LKSDFYLLERDATTMDKLSVGVDCIYIDPPFGLQKQFSMEEVDGSVKSFSDEWNSNEDFLEWYADIIHKCYNNLNKDGWLYCHNNHISNALVLSKLDIVDKYYTNISWKRSHPHNNVKNGWGNIVDSILVFRKGNPYFSVEYKELDKHYSENSFNNKDDVGYYALGPITGEKSRVGHMFKFKGIEPTYGWRGSKEKIKELDKNGLIHYGKNKPYKKLYLSDSKGTPIQNFWDDIHPITRREGRSYPTQKPISLLKRIIKSSCPIGGIVFDPFAGGGTTLSATIECGENRKCITSDISKDSINLIKDKHSSFISNELFDTYELDDDGIDIWKF
jgi:DNA modification methylase